MLSLPSHAAAIQELPHPTIIKKLQPFLGMINFYRRFLPSIAGMLRLLTDELCSSKKGPDKLFACYTGIRHLRYMLDGHWFAIFTDHKPLSYDLAWVSDPWTVCQSRQLSYVAEYTRHIERAVNVVVDTLSKPHGHMAAGRPPSAGTCVKVPSGSQVATLQLIRFKSLMPTSKELPHIVIFFMYCNSYL